MLRKVLILTQVCVAIVPFITLHSMALEVTKIDIGTDIRVRVLANQQKVTLFSSANGIKIVNDVGVVEQLGFPAGQGHELSLTQSGWKLGECYLQMQTLYLKSFETDTLAVNGISYRGSLVCVPVGIDTFDVINLVALEDYLKGVLAKEIFDSWHPETFKVQAIAARSYALANLKKDRHFDLHADIRSQVYGGIQTETEKSRAAVQQTEGIVVAYEHADEQLHVLTTFYSSCCGGISQNANDVWPGVASVLHEFLKARDNRITGVSPCAIAPHYSWGPVTVSKAELSRRLKLWDAKNAQRKNRDSNIEGAGSIKNIKIGLTNEFGRPRSYVVTADASVSEQDYVFNLSAEDLRWVINADATPETTVKSSYFEITVSEDAITLHNGHGWGHAVGMCQWCAQGLALAGKDHKEILAMAYPNTKLVKLW